MPSWAIRVYLDKVSQWQVYGVVGVQVDMTKFELGQRVEFNARDCVQVGTVVERAEAPQLSLEVVIVDTEDGSTWAMHPDSLRFVQEETND